MADFNKSSGYVSDYQKRHEEGGIISLPDMSDANSAKKKKKGKGKFKKNDVQVKRNNQLVNIKEEDTGTFDVKVNKSRSSNIRVGVRLRPIQSKEIDDGQFEIINILGGDSVNFDVQKPCEHKTDEEKDNNVV